MNFKNCGFKNILQASIQLKDEALSCKTKIACMQQTDPVHLNNDN